MNRRGLLLGNEENELRKAAARRGGDDLPQSGQPHLPDVPGDPAPGFREVRPRGGRVHPPGPVHQGEPRVRLRAVPGQARRRGRHGRDGRRAARRPGAPGADGPVRTAPGLHVQPEGSPAAQIRRVRTQKQEPLSESSPSPTEPQPLQEQEPVPLQEPPPLQPIQVPLLLPLQV